MRTYSILAPFPSFPVITVDEWHKMTMPPRMERINAFKEYVKTLEGIDINTVQTNDVFRRNRMPNAPVTGWILATGAWNDEAYWDDAAAWRDN
jgi:hypothetical protein